MADTNSVDGLNGAPWYVAFLVRVGLPTAFAAALLWFLMTNVTQTLTDIVQTQRIQAQSVSQVISNQSKIIELLSRHDESTLASIYLAQAMCYNSAKSDIERGRCADAFRATKH